MRIPATAMTNHLMWTRGGVVWATWRLSPLVFGFANRTKKEFALAHHQALFQALRGEALLLGLCADTDPVTVVDRMLDDIDISDCPDWRDEVVLTLDALEQIPLGTRAFWLSVPIAAGSWKARAFAAWRAADTRIRDAAALPRQMPGAMEIAAAMAAASEIEARIPAAFNPVRATPAEQIWIAAHSQARGLAADAVPPVPAATAAAATGFSDEQLLSFQMPSSMPNPWIDEGGQSDLKRREQFIPFKRRYVKVHGPSMDDTDSYQVVQALVAGPKAGWRSPGVEWISHVEKLPIDVDWAVRMSVTAAADVKKRNKKAESSLEEQYKQQEGSPSITGGGSDLAEIAETLAAYHASLNRSDREVEVQGTILFAVGAPDPAQARARAQYLADTYKGNDFIIEAPLGGQEELWWSMLPGVPTTRLTRELSQITTGREFATGMPLVGNELGDPNGVLFGRNVSIGRPRPILRNMAGNIQADKGGSFGVVAEKGAGKSTLLKTEAGQTVDRGGRIVSIDRTEAREYAIFAQSLDPDHTVIADIFNPTYSVDPLRVFGPRVGARMVQDLFAAMLGLDPLSDRGAFLSSLIEEDYLAGHNITSLRALSDHIARDLTETPESKQLLAQMNVVAKKDIGEVLFNDKLPAMNVDATAIVFLTQGLTLPDPMELANAHLFREMPLEKRFGRAIYAMLMGVTRQLCFFDKTQLAGAILDECHAITASPEGARELRIFFRDDRKHNAFAAVGSHDPDDFGDEVARAMINTRFVMRHTDRNLAVRALRWFDEGAEEDPEMVRIVTEDLSPLDPITGKVPDERRGEGLMLDVAGRIGKFQKSLPQRPDRRAAVLSTPSAVAP